MSKKNKLHSNKPNTKSWQPREDKCITLKSAFWDRCKGAEKIIQLKSKLEKEMNLDNYDSGYALEDIIRDEFRNIIPSRYSINSGVINDRDGKTGGDYDIIIFNDQWFPKIKAGATPQSKRLHFPIDGVYAVGEIKQTLDYNTFDEAMKKLVIAHRLNRPRTFANKIVENRESSNCIHGLSNPLFSFILATNLKEKIEFEELVSRFIDINKTLKRLEVIRALCVLGHGAVVWGYHDDKSNEIKPAMFMMDDLYKEIIPVLHKMPDSESALFQLMLVLYLHLFNSVLAPQDIVAHYGSRNYSIKIPNTSETYLLPDKEWLDIKEKVCSNHK